MTLSTKATGELLKYVGKLEEENKTLKDKIEFLTNCLDDRDKSIELMKEEKKTPLEKQFELVEVNGYKAPRYKWKEIESLIRYGNARIRDWFPYLYRGKEDKEK